MNSEWIERNPAARDLVTLGVINPQRVVVLHPRCRDAEVQVLRCESSGVIFLESAEETTGDFYAHTDPKSPARLGRTSNPPSINDLQRRTDLIHPYVAGRRWVDVGTGSGDLLQSPPLTLAASRIAAVEPNLSHLRGLRASGIHAWPSIDDLGRECPESFELVTLFHVLEHLHEPLASLQQLRTLMADDGILVVEVPHARDVLLETFDNTAFKDFTFWSQHLVLHTRKSLYRLVTKAGFNVDDIRPVQRYPFANHLRWITHGEPGGQEQWSQFDDPLLGAAYDRVLSNFDQTDTIICIALANNGH